MILICDDDATICSSLSLVLKRAGYEVASAENPHEGARLRAPGNAPN